MTATSTGTGIRTGTGTALDASYDFCRALHRRHGTTYWWAARLLPPGARRHVHALYGFCRYADEIVDSQAGTGAGAPDRALADLRERLWRDLQRGGSDDVVLAAVVDTVVHLGIDPGALDRFLRSMEMDLLVNRYETWDDLCRYMDGSAAAIGEMMLAVLDPVDSTAAVGPARALGLAFQLTNFLRDVGEDLDRGRIYIPLEDLTRFQTDPRLRQVTPQWIDLMRFEIARARDLYRFADTGLGLLPRRSAACVRAARVLYSAILDRIEANRFDVFSVRARVPVQRKVATVLLSLMPGRPDGLC